MSRHRLVSVAAPFLLIAAISTGFDLLSGAGVSGESLQFLGSMGSGVLLADALSAWWIRREPRWASLLAGSLAALILLTKGFGLPASTWFDSSLTGVLIGMWTFGFTAVNAFLPSRSIPRTQGSRPARVTPAAFANAEIMHSTQPPGVAITGVSGIRAVTGRKAVEILAAGGYELFEQVSPAQVEQGWLLARAAGSLERLLAQLDAHAGGTARRHRWTDLPKAWRVALHIAAIEAFGSPEAEKALMETLRTSSEVAAIAEGLERPQSN